MLAQTNRTRVPKILARLAGVALLAATVATQAGLASAATAHAAQSIVHASLPRTSGQAVPVADSGPAVPVADSGSDPCYPYSCYPTVYPGETWPSFWPTYYGDPCTYLYSPQCYLADPSLTYPNSIDALNQQYCGTTVNTINAATPCSYDLLYSLVGGSGW